MQQQWWQHKIIFGLGVIGALTYVLESIIGAFIWPVYQPLAYPMAILTAQGAPYRGGFLVTQVIAGSMIAVALAAVSAYHQYQREATMMQGALGMLVSWLLWLIVTSFWPNAKMVDYVISSGFSGKGIVMGVVIILLSATMLYYAKQVQKIDWWSLSNVLTVMALLFVGFNVLEFGVQMLNLPIRGFFDILSTDALVLGLGFTSWYFMRQAI